MAMIENRLSEGRDYSHVQYTMPGICDDATSLTHTHAQVERLEIEDEVRFDLSQLEYILSKHINLCSLSFARSYVPDAAILMVPKVMHVLHT